MQTVYDADVGTPHENPRMGTTELLDFEATWSRRPARLKESAIIDELGMRPARYYMLLHRAARSLEGQAHDPITARTVRDRHRTWTAAPMTIC
jgi:hypothetical protein